MKNNTKLDKALEQLKDGFCPMCHHFYLHAQEAAGCPFQAICLKSLSTLKKDKPIYFKTASIDLVIARALHIK